MLDLHQFIIDQLCFDLAELKFNIVILKIMPNLKEFINLYLSNTHFMRIVL